LIRDASYLVCRNHAVAHVRLLRRYAEEERKMNGDSKGLFVSRHAGRHRRCLALVCLSLALALPASAAVARDQTATHKATSDHRAANGASLDHSGKPRKGRASYYSRSFYKKKMADGTPMNPQSNAAASKTLPLGTTAQVTNLENGKSAVVEIKDRGPYVANRIVDVTPKTADTLGLKKDGTAPVEVKPMSVPQPDGTVKTAQ
jgi:rare lipoprotein A